MKVKDLKEDFLNPISTRAISAEGLIFKIGDKVKHSGVDENEIGTILSFYLNKETNDVIARTDKGTGRISFMYH
jgi:hypothetical protein